VNFPNNPLDISSAPNGGFAEDVAKDCQQIKQTTLMVLLCHVQPLCSTIFTGEPGEPTTKGLEIKLKADDFALVGPEKNVTYPKFTEYFAFLKNCNIYSRYVTTDTLHKRNLSKKFT